MIRTDYKFIGKNKIIVYIVYDLLSVKIRLFCKKQGTIYVQDSEPDSTVIYVTIKKRKKKIVKTITNDELIEYLEQLLINLRSQEPSEKVENTLEELKQLLLANEKIFIGTLKGRTLMEEVKLAA